jgi:shikimate dehydrogenase
MQTTSVAPSLPVDASTEFVWIVGDPITQVKAPQAMNPHYLKAGDNLLVLPAPVSPGDLRDVFQAARQISNLRGWIVTVPHKVTLVGWLDELSPAAQLAGAVNAIRFRKGRSFGDLFDGVGFVAGLRGRGFTVEGTQALVLGAGGVGSAICLALAEAGADRVAIYDIDADRARLLVERLAKESWLRTRFEPGHPNTSAGFDLLVNASPIGMGGDTRSPLDTRQLRPSHTVAEVVMSPEMTPLLLAARAAGCAIHPGKQVLEGQLQTLLDFFR